MKIAILGAGERRPPLRQFQSSKKTTWNDMDSGCTGAWIYLCIFNCRRNETTIENRGKKNNGRKLSEKRQSKSDRKQ